MLETGRWSKCGMACEIIPFLVTADSCEIKHFIYAEKILNWKESRRALHACSKSWVKSGSGKMELQGFVSYFGSSWR